MATRAFYSASDCRLSGFMVVGLLHPKPLGVGILTKAIP